MSRILRPVRSLIVLGLALAVTLGITLALATSARAEEASAASSKPFAGTALAPLHVLLGNWEIQDKWADGTALWARNEYELGLGGKFLVARTFAKDGDGEVYERYYTVFAQDAAGGGVKSYGFTYDGTAEVVDVEVGGEAGRESLTARWSAGGSDFKQTVQLQTADAYNWKVWMRPSGGGEWVQLMDGTWKRVR